MFTSLLQFFNAASLGWNLVWVLNFTLELWDPLRNTASLHKYYNGLVWSYGFITTLYVWVAGIYGCVPLPLLLCVSFCGLLCTV